MMSATFTRTDDNATDVISYTNADARDCSKLRVIASVLKDLTSREKPSSDDLNNDDDYIELYDKLFDLSETLENLGYDSKGCIIAQKPEGERTNMTTVMDEDVEINDDKYKIVLTYTNEGLCGDYDENNTDDYPRIRVDVYDIECMDETIASTCTEANANMSVDDAKEYAAEILKKFESFINAKFSNDSALAMAI